jgi:hydroxyacylglutathione hydrolase
VIGRVLALPWCRPVPVPGLASESGAVDRSSKAPRFPYHGAAPEDQSVLFERFEDKGLSQYSYAVGCENACSIAIVDPRRDVDAYIEFADARQARITHVLETHIHADFASGAWELAERTGAALYLSAYDDGELYEVAFPHCELRDHDRLVLGRVHIEALHTPGHTPEHVAFLVYDTARTADVPELLLSGDFLFVGSVGRPDLIGDEAKVRLARAQYESVQRIAHLPDGVEVHPGHGAGSMCGAGMGARPMSTLGFERVANPFLARQTSDAFVERILGQLPPFPPYYRRMKALNARGPQALNGVPGQRPVQASEFHALVEEGHLVIDLRDQFAYGSAHIPRAFGIGVGANLSTWASWVVPYEQPILLVASAPPETLEAARALVRVGLDDIRGHLDGGMQAWIGEGYPITGLRQESPAGLLRELAREPGLQVLDVRTEEEWRSGHVCGATHLMGGYLPDRATELAQAGRAFALVCQTGYRSTVAASVLERAGAPDLRIVTGGMTAWEQTGLPVCRG